MESVRLRVVAIVIALIAFQTRVVAERSWVEVKSPHFTIVSNESERSARTVAWQFEQMREVLHSLWAWARVDTAKPIFVLAVGDEASMRALAPQYWEQKGGVRPASVFVEAADRYIIALRSDLRADDREGLNPYITAYWSYVALVLNSSLDRDLPLWFQRGLAGIFSNTIVRDTSIQLGRVIPWYLQRLQQGSRLRVRDLLTIDRQSPWYTQADRLDQFDAECWAFMHFLMFGDDGAHRSQLDRFMALLHAGKLAPAALEEGFGNLDALQSGFSAYFTQRLYQYQRVDVDTRTTKEGFQGRPVPASESASLRAAFHTALNRPVEARAAIDEARKADARQATTYETEGILLDSDRKNDSARVAYAKAVELGSKNFFAYYRLAALMWVQGADSDTLASIKKSLEQSIVLNDRFAPALGLLGEANAHLGRPEDALNAARRAVSLDGGVTQRLSLARVLWTISRPDEAASEARNALTIARTEGERRTAQELLDFFQKNRHPSAAAAASSRLVVDFGFDYFGPVPSTAATSTASPATKLANRVKEFWSVPADVAAARGHVVATMTIDETGTITDIAIDQAASINAFNIAARDALAHLDPTPLSPEDNPSGRTRLTATFFYNEASTPGVVPLPSNWPPPGASRPGNGVVLPRLVREVKPQYTRLAMKAGIHGTVVTEIIVRKDGTVGTAVVVRSLDQTFGLDQEALKAVRQWRFEPGTLKGEAVDVLVSIELTFTLK